MSKKFILELDISSKVSRSLALDLSSFLVRALTSIDYLESNSFDKDSLNKGIFLKDNKYIEEQLAHLSKVFSSVPYNNFLIYDNEDYYNSKIKLRDTSFVKSSGVIQQNNLLILPDAGNYLFNFKLFKVAFTIEFLESLFNWFSELDEKIQEELKKNLGLSLLYNKLNSLLNDELSPLNEKYQKNVTIPGFFSTNITSFKEKEYGVKHIFVGAAFLKDNKAYTLRQIVMDLVLGSNSEFYYNDSFRLNHLNLNFYSDEQLINSVKIRYNKIVTESFKDLEAILYKLDTALDPFLQDILKILNDDASYNDINNKISTFQIFYKIFYFQYPVFFKLEHYFEFAKINMGKNLKVKYFDLDYYLGILQKKVFKNFLEFLLVHEKFKYILDSNFIKNITHCTLQSRTHSLINLLRAEVSPDFRQIDLVNSEDLFIFVSESKTILKVQTFAELTTYFYEDLLRGTLNSFITFLGWQSGLDPNTYKYMQYVDLKFLGVVELFEEYIRNNRVLENSEYYEVLKKLYDK